MAGHKVCKTLIGGSIPLRASKFSNPVLALVCDGAGCCGDQAQRTNTPENIDRFLGGEMPCPKDLKRLTIGSRVSINRECSHSADRLF
jgi:hypothetical protein